MKLNEEEKQLIIAHRKSKEQTQAMNEGEKEAFKELGKEITQMRLQRIIYGDW